MWYRSADSTELPCTYNGALRSDLPCARFVIICQTTWLLVATGSLRGINDLLIDAVPTGTSRHEQNVSRFILLTLSCQMGWDLT